MLGLERVLEDATMLLRGSKIQAVRHEACAEWKRQDTFFRQHCLVIKLFYPLVRKSCKI